MRRVLLSMTTCALALFAMMAVPGEASAQEKKSPAQILTEMNAHVVKGEWLEVAKLGKHIYATDPSGTNLNTVYANMTMGQALLFLGVQAEKDGNKDMAVDYLKASSFYNQMGAELLRIRSKTNTRTYQQAYDFFFSYYKISPMFIDYSFTR